MRKTLWIMLACLPVVAAVFHHRPAHAPIAAAVESAPVHALYAVAATREHVFAVGENGAVMHSADAGRSWFEQQTGVDEDLRAVWAASPTDVYAVGDGGRILHLVRDGVWTVVASGVDADLHAVWGSSPEDVYAAGERGCVLHSSDRGATWTLVDSGTDEDLTALAGLPDGVVAVGESGVLRRLSLSRHVAAERSSHLDRID